MVLLDGGGDHPGHADAVATHEGIHGVALVIQNDRLHGLAVGGAELKYVPDLDPAGDGQGAAPIGRWISLDGVAKVGDHGLGQVTAPVDAGVVAMFGVGATDEIRHRRCGSVADHGHVDTHRTQGSGPAAEVLGDALGARHGQGFAHLFQSLGFDRVEAMIAAHGECDQGTVLSLDHQGLQALFGGDAEKRAQLGDGVHIRRGDSVQTLAGRWPRTGGRRAGDEFQVGREIAAGSKGNSILAGVGENMEFVGAAAADGPRIRFDDAKVESRAGEDARVGFVHGIVALLMRLQIQIK